jgi:hypothetical protein
MTSGRDSHIKENTYVQKMLVFINEFWSRRINRDLKSSYKFINYAEQTTYDPWITVTFAGATCSDKQSTWSTFLHVLQSAVNPRGTGWRENRFYFLRLLSCLLPDKTRYGVASSWKKNIYISDVDL